MNYILPSFCFLAMPKNLKEYIRCVSTNSWDLPLGLPSLLQWDVDARNKTRIGKTKNADITPRRGPLILEQMTPFLNICKGSQG